MLTVRPATPDDHAAFARLFPRLEVDDETPSPARFEAEMVATTRLAELDGAIAGYTYFQIFGDRGYVRHVVTDAAAVRRGVATALLEAVRAEVRARGLARWCLNVKPENAAARALYERLGMRPAYASRALRLDWAVVDGLPRGGAAGREALPADDLAALEARFGLPAGQLSKHAALPGRALGLAERGARVVGLAAFDPGFPGAYPFDADDLDAARAALEAVRPHARHAHLNLVLEARPRPGGPTGGAVARALLEAGATLRLEILHYEGDV